MNVISSGDSRPKLRFEVLSTCLRAGARDRLGNPPARARPAGRAGLLWRLAQSSLVETLSSNSWNQARNHATWPGDKSTTAFGLIGGTLSLRKSVYFQHPKRMRLLVSTNAPRNAKDATCGPDCKRVAGRRTAGHPRPMSECRLN